MRESWSVGLTRLTVDAPGDASQHSFPWHEMFLTAMLPKEIQQGGVLLIRRLGDALRDERELNFDNAGKRLSQSLKLQSCRAIITESRGGKCRIASHSRCGEHHWRYRCRYTPSTLRLQDRLRSGCAVELSCPAGSQVVR